MQKRYYIAYGSNLNIRQMKFRCPTARIIGTATLPDYELLFKGSKTGSYLTVEPKQGKSVPVAVWETTEADEAALVGIRTGKVRKRKVYVYIMHEDRPIGIPSYHYVATCLEGYRAFEFDENILFQAIEKSRRECHED